MLIRDGIYYVGVNDHEVDLFEGQYKVENGMAYNSYVIKDERIAVFDTVSESFGAEWLGKIEEVLEGREPDYLIVQHMEPDHSGNIDTFVKKYPNVTVVATAMAFNMMRQFYGSDYASNRIIVKEKDTLELGKHHLTFIMAPMVHWPEVMVTYDSDAKTLFSADGFGKFGALDVEEDWECEARRYYFGIVGKFGMQTNNLLNKAKTLDIEMICPTHGPVLKENIGYYLGLYQTWANYDSESEGILIAYSSIYGHTRKAALLLAEKIKELGYEKVSVTDLARDDMAEAVEDAFRYNKLVLATTTYNTDIFPCMKEFINHLTERNFQKKKVAIIENGSWAPQAGKVMKGMLEKCKNLEYAQNNVTILSALNDSSILQIENLAKELVA